MEVPITNTNLVSLTGDRPTGPLHLGHYVGSLRQRIKLQNECDQYIMIADMQGLTDNGFNPGKVSENILQVMADYLAVGLLHDKNTFFLQSAIPALAELTMLYMNVVTVSRVERNPTVKNEIKQKKFGHSIPVGFMIYPISQAADISAFKADLVPVGDDQLPMIEQTNEIVNKMNSLFSHNILKTCKPVISDIGRLPGIDGNAKMSKSLGNTLNFFATNDDINKAVRNMYTDPSHLKISDPGKVEGNVVFSWLDAFHPNKTDVDTLKKKYQLGGLGDSSCKKILAEILIELIAPIRSRREEFISEKDFLVDILKKGSSKAKDISDNTLFSVKRELGISIF